MNKTKAKLTDSKEISVSLESSSYIGNKHFIYDFSFYRTIYKGGEFVSIEELGNMRVSRLDNRDLYNDIEKINGCESFYEFIGKNGLEEDKLCSLLDDRRYSESSKDKRSIFVIDHIQIYLRFRGNKLFRDILRLALELIGARGDDILLLDSAPHYFSDYDDKCSELELERDKEKLKRYYEFVGFKEILAQKNTNVMISLVEDILKPNTHS